MDKKTNFNAWYIVVAVLGMLLLQAIFQQAQQTEPLPYSQFRQYLEQGKLDDLLITETRITGKIKNPGEGEPSGFVTTRIDPALRAGAREARRHVPRRQRSELLHHAAVLGAAGADLLRHLDVPDAAHGGGRHGRRRPDVDRQEPGQDLRREGHQDHARRRRRGRRGQGRGPGDHRFPEGPQGLRRARGAPAARRAPDRSARHRQDPARARGRGRGGRHVPVDQRLRVRRDVRRRRRRAGARPVRAGAQDGALHHLHRRAGRARPRARPRPHGRRPRREGADPEPAPGRAGRLRSEPGHHPARRDQPAGDPRPGAAAARSLRPPDPGRSPGQAGPHPDPRGACPEDQAGARRQPRACRRAHAGLHRRGSGQSGQRGGAARDPPARPGGHHGRLQPGDRAADRRAGEEEPPAQFHASARWSPITSSATP